MRAAREARGWSQRQLAQELSSRSYRIDPSAITRIEKGQRDVRLAEAIRIAIVLELSLDEATMWDYDGFGRFSRYLDLMRTAMLQARRHMVSALNYADMAADQLDDHERAFASAGVTNLAELWEGVAVSMERIWQTRDPVVGSMWVLTGTDEDAAMKRRIVGSVLADLLVSEAEFLGGWTGETKVTRSGPANPSTEAQASETDALDRISDEHSEAP